MNDISVLVLEDDDDWSMILKESIIRSGLNCMTASTLTEARELLHKHEFKIVTVDLRLADYDANDRGGLEFLREIKRAKIPLVVIIISAYAELDMEQLFKTFGVWDVIDKSSLRPSMFEAVLKEAARSL